MAYEDKTRVLPAGGQAPACDQLREMVSMVVQETIHAEFERFLGAAPYERTPARRGHRNGSYAAERLEKRNHVALQGDSREARRAEGLPSEYNLCDRGALPRVYQVKQSAEQA